jgi:hypothetical protein
MKRIIQGLVLATLISTAQASPFPDNGDPVSLPVQWTYADRHAGEVVGDMGSAIPGNGDPVNLPTESTYADRFAGEVIVDMGSAIAGDGDPVSLPTESTYADQFTAERARQAAASIE